MPGSFTISGNSFPEGGAPRAERLEAGYALTYGVPKKLWEAWLADNKDMPAVVNGLIFAFPMCVGMNRHPVLPPRAGPGVPHVRGDEPPAETIVRRHILRSPCAWG